MPRIARNDYECSVCGIVETHVIEYGSRPPHCGVPMVWLPKIGRMDSYDVRAFDVNHNGQTFHIDSLSKLRQVERQTEQQHRNGEGSPLVWRDYSQERSNVGVHTLAKDVTQPVGGYAEGTSGVDRKFAGGRGDAVTKKHGEAT